MAEVLVEYTDVVLTKEGRRYAARACGAETENGTWHGWLEFIDLDTGGAIRSPRETTQPNRTDTAYWATGLTAVYLEGALSRALHPLPKPAARSVPSPAFEGPADTMGDAPGGPLPDSILNPFSVYRKGEALLRRQLAALSVWHLVNIVQAHELSDQSSTALNAMTSGELIELIVRAVKARSAEALSR
jgi:hypothetical protein